MPTPRHLVALLTLACLAATGCDKTTGTSDASDIDEETCEVANCDTGPAEDTAADTSPEPDTDEPEMDTADAAEDTAGAEDTEADTAPDTSSDDTGSADTSETSDAADTTTADATDASPDGGGLDPEDIVLSVDFDDVSLGKYSEDDYDSQWPEADWLEGLQDGRGDVVENPEDSSDQVLEVLYPAGEYGPNDQGVQMKILFDNSYDELYLRYRVRFEKDFEWVKGGKLPGLIGGEANTGGDVPDGTDGWSARMMWRRGGHAVQYVYHPDQSGTYGEDMSYELNGNEVDFQDGTWHTVQHRIVMNTPGQSDGRIQAWFDGQLALDRQNMRFRDVSDFAVDGFYFSTFFGGGDDSWAPDSDMHIYYDNFVVAEEKIPAP